jgi:hypothetical protein
MRRAPGWGPSTALDLIGLDDLNVRRLQALLALNDLELDALTLLERLVALLSDG